MGEWVDTSVTEEEVGKGPDECCCVCKHFDAADPDEYGREKRCQGACEVHTGVVVSESIWCKSFEEAE